MLRGWVVKSRPFSKLHMHADTMGGQKPPQSLPKSFQKLPQTLFKTKVERGLQAQVHSSVSSSGAVRPNEFWTLRIRSVELLRSN